MRPLKDLPEELRAGILMLAVGMPRGFETADVAEKCGVTPARAYRAIARLRDDGVIACTWVGAGCRWTTTEKVSALRDKLHREALEKDQKRRAAWHKARNAQKKESYSLPRVRRVASVWDLAGF